MMTPSILEKALDATRNSREKQYAHPILNFARTAQLWDTYLRMVGVTQGISLTPEHVAQMMVLFKIAREVATHIEDNLIDEAGYTDCVDRIHQVLQKMGYTEGISRLRELTRPQLEVLYSELEELDPSFYEGT